MDILAIFYVSVAVFVAIAAVIIVYIKLKQYSPDTKRHTGGWDDDGSSWDDSDGFDDD